MKPFKEFVSESQLPTIEVDTTDIPFMTDDDAMKYGKKGYFARMSARPVASFPDRSWNTELNMNSAQTPVGIYGWDLGVKKHKLALIDLTNAARMEFDGGFPVFNRRAFIHIFKVDSKKIFQLGGKENQIGEIGPFLDAMEWFYKSEYTKRRLEPETVALIVDLYKKMRTSKIDEYDDKGFGVIADTHAEKIYPNQQSEQFALTLTIQKLVLALCRARTNFFNNAEFYDFIRVLSKESQTTKNMWAASDMLMNAGFDAISDSAGGFAKIKKANTVFNEAEKGQIAVLNPNAVKHVKTFRNPWAEHLQQFSVRKVDWSKYETYDTQTIASKQKKD